MHRMCNFRNAEKMQKEPNHLGEQFLHLSLLGILCALLQQNIAVTGQQLRTLTRRLGLRRHRVLIDKRRARLKQNPEYTRSQRLNFPSYFSLRSLKLRKVI